MPRFKWAQNKDLLFVSVMVRDLNRDSVNVSCSAEAFTFRASSTTGESYALDLVLREDINPADMKHELASRPDKWGTAVFVTLSKVQRHRWDLLVDNPKKYKGFMDKDWTREDTSLEPEDEKPYMEVHSSYLVELTEANFNKTLKKYDTIVANVRFPWCTRCNIQDEAFAKAAKQVKNAGKKDKTWKKIGFAVVDAREQLTLGRRLGLPVCGLQCHFRAVSEGLPTVQVKGEYGHEKLVESVRKFLTPPITELTDASALEDIKNVNTTCFAGFESKAAPEYASFLNMAAKMRGELTFAAVFGESRAPELWHEGVPTPATFDGTMGDDGAAFGDWLRPRAPKVLQVLDYTNQQKYEALAMPLAKLWVDDKDANPALTQIAQRIVRDVAPSFSGRMLFVQNDKYKSHELRSFGLSENTFPAFAVTSNASYDTRRFEPGVAFTPEFWQQDEAQLKGTLSDFLEQVLAGTWPESHKSAQPQTNWTQGSTREIVWKTFKDMQASEKPMLLQLYSKYRGENERKTLEVDHLATSLAAFADSFTVARYETTENHLPPAFSRQAYSSDDEWYWLPAGDAPHKQLKKPRVGAPIKKVVQFLKAQSGLDTLDVEEVMKKYEQLLEDMPPPTTTPMPSSMDDMGSMASMFGGGGDDPLSGMKTEL